MRKGSSLALLLAGALALPTAGAGEEGAAPSRKGHWKRAFLEEAGMLAIGGIGYALQPLAALGAHPVSAMSKLTLRPGAVAFDSDPAVVNYVGHPLAGMGYYLVARGNRLSVPESILITAVPTLGWELVEYREPLGLSDVVANMAGGVAIGEAMTQMGAYFDRGEGGPADELLGWMFQPARRLHDLWDGVPQPRGEPRGWHEFRFRLGAGAAGDSLAERETETRLSARTRIVRAPGYGEPGSGWEGLLDANVTGLSVEASFGPWGEDALEVGAEASLAGLYGRDLEESGGQDILAVLDTAFDYRRQVYTVDGARAGDELILLHVPGLSIEHRTFLGPARLELRLGAALLFGAVDSHALVGASLQRPDLPLVMQLRGYYHGIGAMVEPRAGLRVGPVAVGARARVEALSAITSDGEGTAPPGGYADLEDRLVELEGWASGRLPWNGLEVGATLRRSVRSGRAGDASRTSRESGAWLWLGLAI